MIVLELTPTVSNGTAYAADDAVGGIMTLAGCADVGLIHHVVIVDNNNQKKDMDLVLFSAAPTTPTADNAAFAVASGDIAKVIGVIPMTTHKSIGAVGMTSASGLSLPFKAVQAGSLFAQLVTRGTPTYTSTSALRVCISLLKGGDAE